MKSPFPCPWTWDLGMSVLMRANELLMVLACVNWGLEGKFGFICAWKWKGSDIRLSMETRTRNPCSAFNPFKVHTHSSEHTHTHTHTVNTHSEQWAAIYAAGPEEQLGALFKGTSVVVLRMERALGIHTPHLQFLPARDSNLQPLDYESDSLTIKSRLPPQMYACMFTSMDDIMH